MTGLQIGLPILAVFAFCVHTYIQNFRNRRVDNGILFCSMFVIASFVIATLVEFYLHAHAISKSEITFATLIAIIFSSVLINLLLSFVATKYGKYDMISLTKFPISTKFASKHALGALLSMAMLTVIVTILKMNPLETVRCDGAGSCKIVEWFVGSLDNFFSVIFVICSFSSCFSTILIITSIKFYRSIRHCSEN